MTINASPVVPMNPCSPVLHGWLRPSSRSCASDRLLVADDHAIGPLNELHVVGVVMIAGEEAGTQSLRCDRPVNTF